MKYTESDLFRAVIAIIPSFEKPLKTGAIHMPVACHHAAEKCFTTQRTEDGHSAILRQALQDLSKGQFNYEEEYKHTHSAGCQFGCPDPDGSSWKNWRET